MKKLLMLLITIYLITGCKNHPSVISEQDIPRSAKKVNAKLENGDIELVAFMTEPRTPRHGESFKVVTFWKLKKQLPEGYQLFYHFQYDDGEMVMKPFNRHLLDGSLKELPTGKIIRDDANIKELPLSFDGNKLQLYGGFYKGNHRLSPEKKFNDGLNRLKFPIIKTDKSPVVKKRIDVYAIAGESRKFIKIDGKLDESFWKNAQRGGVFWKTNGKKIADNQTDVMVAMDDKYLYVGFDVNDKDIYSPYKNNDDPIYNHDVVEVFIDADGDKDEYFELQVSPANIKFDSSFKGGPRRGKNVSWDSKMKFAAHLNGTLNNHNDKDTGWSAEMAIPFTSITDSQNIPPKDGDIWKVYFYRIEKSKDKSKSEYTAWIPPYKGDFHYLRFMGDMKFIYELIK